MLNKICNTLLVDVVEMQLEIPTLIKVEDTTKISSLQLILLDKSSTPLL